MYCQNCGKEVTGKFCSNCGAETVLNERVPKNNHTVKILNIVSLLLSELTVFLYVYLTFKNGELYSDFILALILSGAFLVLNFLPFLSELLPIKKGISLVAHGLRLAVIVLIGFIGIVYSLAVTICALVALIVDVITLILNAKKFKSKDKTNIATIITSVILALSFISPTAFGLFLRDFQNSICPNFVINDYEVKNWQADCIDENYIIRDGMAGKLAQDKLTDFEISERQSDVLDGTEYEKKHTYGLIERENVSIDNGYLTAYSVRYNDITIDDVKLGEIMRAYNEILGGKLVFTNTEDKSYTFEQLATASFTDVTVLSYQSIENKDIHLLLDISVYPSGLCSVGVSYLFFN